MITIKPNVFGNVLKTLFVLLLLYSLLLLKIALEVQFILFLDDG